MYDVIIIGAGVVGAAIARELTKFNIRIMVIEKEKDVALGASKANSGIVHGGYAGKFGTLKGALCIRGNRMFETLDSELNFGFKRIGGMILGYDEQDRERLQVLVDNGKAVGQDDFKWLNQKEVRKHEPYVHPQVQFGLYMPSIGIVSPYEMTIALVENAVSNGLELKLDEQVQSIKYKDQYLVMTNKSQYTSKWIINAAGLDAGRLNDFFDDRLIIHPRRGQYILFGKDQSHLVNHVLFQPPTDKGKGILVTTTFHGNFMIGPDAEDLDEHINTDTQLDRLKEIIEQARQSIPGFNIKRALTTFSGIRAMATDKDFFIKEVHPGFITVGGIDSPGLTSSPAIAEYVREILEESMVLCKKEDFNPYRPSYYVKTLSEVVCHCEQKTKAMVKRCFEGPIPILSTDAVKRRMRAGMGTCQGHRCQGVIRKMISDYYNIPQSEVPKRTESQAPERIDIHSIRQLN